MLAELEADLVAVHDESGTTTWSSQEEWLGRDLRASILSGNALVVALLLGEEPHGP